MNKIYSSVLLFNSKLIFLPKTSALDIVVVSCGCVWEGKRLGNFAATLSGQTSPVKIKVTT